jgi:Protein of unknown function (DUF3592)
MLLTPDRGKRIFGVLTILAALGIIAGSLGEWYRSKSRTSVVEAKIVSAHESMMGIGPLRHYSIHTRYEFVAGGERIDKEQEVDSLTAAPVYVRFDPEKPANSSLELPDSRPRFRGLLAGLLMFVGVGLLLRVWSPRVRPKSGGNTSQQKT